jgi:hypothetical protein
MTNDERRVTSLRFHHSPGFQLRPELRDFAGQVAVTSRLGRQPPQSKTLRAWSVPSSIFNPPSSQPKFFALFVCSLRFKFLFVRFAPFGGHEFFVSSFSLQPLAFLPPLRVYFLDSGRAGDIMKLTGNTNKKQPNKNSHNPFCSGLHRPRRGLRRFTGRCGPNPNPARRHL